MEFLNELIDNFENQSFKNQKNFGVIYTPNEIADFIVKSIFKICIKDLLQLYGYFTKELDIHNLIQFLVRNDELKEIINKKIENIKVLDPSCGSGRFLISVAKLLFNLRKKINPSLKEFDLKKKIIQNNIYGIDIDKSSCYISKLKLLNWIYSDQSDQTLYQNTIETDLKNLNKNDIGKIFQHINIKLNVYNLDYLLEFDKDNYFDFIIGNPPYIENKKLKNKIYKKQLYNKFYSAYRLFDISILFIEKSLQILKKNTGYISFILPNKFLSSDYGIKIRDLLINKTELREIINISSLPVFHKTATYPVILSLKNRFPSGSNEIIIKTYSDIGEIIKSNVSEFFIFSQKLINQLPSNVIPISGNIELISHLYSKFKTISETFNDLKIIYRPFGFLKYSKFFDNISEKRKSKKDLLLIGTGNVGKYHLKYKKRIKIAKKDIKVSYFNYKPAFKDIWDDLSSEKIIFREIAKDLTCVFDLGVLTNITGLYFIRIPSIDINKLICLMTILNSKLIDTVFKSLFSTLHMSGGYLRFNGSFIKRLPMPNQLPVSLYHIGKIIQFLSQLKYEMIKSELKIFKEIDIKNIKIHLEFFKKLANSLVFLLYFEENYEKSNKSYNILSNILYSEVYFPNIQIKYLTPRFNLANFKIFPFEKLKSVLLQITNIYNKIKANKKIQIEIENIIKFSTSYL
ncbi:MAG: Eco57I restriction-modification methylase domain-containing protein [Candidatus Hodarchaeota archaeon]